MARCGCSGRSCNCLIQAGSGIDVTGSGTADDPYIIIGTSDIDISDAIRFIDTESVNFTVTGSGTETDPWTVTAISILDVGSLSDVVCDGAAPNDVLTWDGTNWVCAPISAEPGAINTAEPVTGDGTVGAPITLVLETDQTLQGSGTAADPLRAETRVQEGLTVCPTTNPDAGSNTSVTFPYGQFDGEPSVTTNPTTTAPHQRAVCATSVTVSGFIMRYVNTGGSAIGVNVRWIAAYTRVAPAPALLRTFSASAEPEPEPATMAAQTYTTPEPDCTVECSTWWCRNRGIRIPMINSWWDEEMQEQMVVDKFTCGVCSADITDSMILMDDEETPPEG